MKKIFALALLIMCMSFVLIGCTTNDDPVPVYNMVTYNVYHYFEDVNGVYSGQDLIQESFEIRKGSTVTIQSKSVDFFTFKSSISSASGTVNNDNTSFYLYYTRNIYTIYLMDTLTSVNSQINSKHGKSITLPTRTYQTKTFMGWSYDQAGQNMATLTEMPTQNITLYAVWID